MGLALFRMLYAPTQALQKPLGVFLFQFSAAKEEIFFPHLKTITTAQLATLGMSLHFSTMWVPRASLKMKKSSP